MAREPNESKDVQPRPIALDPFFLFTYSLLVLTGLVQVFLMVWMDVF